MRADRLLSILLLLQVHRRMTAADLARRLEVSSRTVHRDLEALAAAGVPVYAERGSGGGWALPDGYQTNLTGLKPDEITALFLQPLRVLSDLGLGKASEAALTKLLAALPASNRAGAEHARQRLHVDMSTWRGGGDVAPCLNTVQDALWQDRRLAFAYEKGDGSRSERTADPLGLVAKGNIWYLVAAEGEEIKSFRIARIQRAEALDQPAQRPPSFDLASYWAQTKSDFVAALPTYTAEVRVNPAILPRLRFSERFARIGAVAPPDSAGWQRVVVRFDTADEALGYALGFGPDLEVLAPADLRERVALTAQQIANRYR